MEFYSAILGGLFVLFGTWLAWCWSDEKNNQKIKYTLEALNEEMNELFKIMEDIFR